MTIPAISPAQTAANSPLNETLLEGLRQRSTLTPLGSIIWQYDFDGLIPAPEGYMRMNGDQITEANYNAIHGAGAWAAQIGVSLLAGRYTPNVADRYLTDGDTQTGMAPITAVGAAGNTINTAENISHNHQIYSSKGDNLSDKIYNSSGNEIDPPVAPSKTAMVGVKIFNDLYISYSGTTLNTLSNWYSKTKTSTIGNAAQSIQPDTIKAKAWIRII